MIKKFIRGNAERGAEVIAELEKLCGKNPTGIKGHTTQDVYYIGRDGEITWENINTEKGQIIQECFEEIHLPEKEEQKFDPSTLKPFDKVVVRDDDWGLWDCSFFSHINAKNKQYPYKITSIDAYKQCIPYNDDTKHLVGTNQRPPKYYDIWD